MQLASLDEWSGDLQEAVNDESLTKISRIGAGIATVITDLVKRGSSAAQDDARANVPPQLPQLLKISGLGPKRVRTLWTELAIDGPEALEKAIESGRLSAVRGFWHEDD